jgi:DNA polymerase-1
MTEHPGRLVLIDSFGLIYRAFFALPPMTNSKGQATNAVLGFVNMLTRIISDEKPAYLIAAFDRGVPQARIDRFPAYKAQREEMPDDLRSQIPLVRRVLEAFCIPIVEKDNEEADDIIATLARKAEKAHEVRIITGDLDLLQLVDERTTVVVPKRSINDLVNYDPAAVRERYGLEPKQLPDYRGLKGDPSDNLTGVPGIGEKTASKLIGAAGTLDALLADPSKAGTAKLQKLLEVHADAARLCRDISVSVCDLDVEMPWDEAEFTGPDLEKLATLYRDLDFRSHLAKLNVGDANTPGVSSETVERLSIVGEYQEFGAAVADDARQALRAALSGLKTYKRLAFARRDGEIGIAWDEGKALSFDRAALADAEICDILVGLISKVDECVVHDAKQLFAEFRGAGARRSEDPAPAADTAKPKKRGASKQQTALFDGPDLFSQHDALPSIPTVLLQPRFVADDTMVAAYVLNPTRAYHLLSDVVQDVLGKALPPQTAAWADAVWRSAIVVREQLAQREQLALYEDVELPSMTVLAQMEAVGILLDQPELRHLAVDIDAEVERTQRDIFALAGEEFNLGSPQQLGRILFEKLAMPGGKRNKTGYATGVEVLATLAEEFEIAKRVLEYREAAKLKNTYVDVLPTLVDADGRLRTTFQQTATTTGRLSSINPNLQNIPVRGELGRRIRKAFVAGGPGRILIAADYSQIELRLMAHLSGDQAMRTAFIDGHDIHDETARKIFAVPSGFPVENEQRRIAKSVNFGLLYGMGEFGLGQRLGIPRDEARRIVEAYFGQFPGVRGYLDATVAFGREHGYVLTIAGRRRYLPDLAGRDHHLRAAAEREATNAPLQGSAADLMKIAMIRVQEALRDHDAQLLLQIHDEFIIEAAESELREVAGKVRAIMSSAMELSVPLDVSVKTGKTWYDVAAYDDTVVGDEEVFESVGN